MPTMSQIFQEARTLPSRERARLVSKLIAVDLPDFVTDEKELARREDEVRSGQVRPVKVSSVMREARALAGIGGKAPSLQARKA